MHLAAVLNEPHTRFVILVRWLCIHKTDKCVARSSRKVLGVDQELHLLVILLQFFFATNDNVN